MSFFHARSNFLSAKLQVLFEHGAMVNMYGGANTGTSYSLPGHIIISIPTLPAPLQGRLRELRDLKLVMEGKSEFFDEQGRYSSMRLCTTTLDLATPSQPLIIPSYDPSRPHAMRFQLAIPFDLRVPGWLPPSHVSPMTSTAYGVMAHSELGWAETSSPPQRESLISHKSTDNHRRSSFRRNHSNGLFPRQSLDPTSTDKSASKFISFTIHRHHLLPPGLNLANGRTERHFVLRPEVDSASPIECVVTAPSWVDVNGGEKALKVTLRVRGRRNDVLFTPAISLQEQTNDEDDHPPQPLDSELGETLPKAGYSGDEILTYLLELGMEVEEVERFSSTPAATFLSHFPMPAEQPTHHSPVDQFISPPSIHANRGSLSREDRPFRQTRTHSCLLTDDGVQRSFFFPDDGLGLGDRCRKVNVIVPMPRKLGKVMISRPQPDMDGPFLRIKHFLKIRVVCRDPGSLSPDTVVTLRTPIRFCTSLDTISTIDGPKYLPLPAYVQLFHENGDIRQCDPLPLYSETEDSNPAPPASSLADCVAAASAYTPRYPSPADLPEYENEINAAAAFAPGVGADVEGVSDGETVPTIVESTSRNEQGKAGVRSPAPPLRPKETDGRRASVAATVLRTRAQLA